MKRFDLNRYGLLTGTAVVLGGLTGCAAGPRPQALDQASAMLTHQQVGEIQALKPKLVREAKTYLRKATEAHERGERREAELYAHMAMNRFLTAQNLVKSTSARRLAKKMVAQRGSVAGEAEQLRSRQAELKRFSALEARIQQIHAALNKKPEGDAPDVVAAKRALSRARRKQAEAIGAGAPTTAPTEYQQGLSLVTSAVESLELGIYTEAQQTASQAVTVFDGAIAKARAPKPDAPPDPKLADKQKAENALTDASSSQALALASGAPQSSPNVYQRGTVLLSSAERHFDRENYSGARQLARQAKEAFDASSAGPTAAAAPVTMTPDASSAGTVFDNRPIDQILLSLRFKRASMLGKRQNETCPATFKEFEAILELADERLKMGDTRSAREFVIRAQERLLKCEDPTRVEVPAAAPAAEPKVDPSLSLKKQHAASAIQKAQTTLAGARRTIGTDPRLAQPQALLASAEKWFDRESYGQAEQLADQAVVAVAGIVAAPAPKPVPAPAADAVKDEAAALIQKGQTLYADLIVRLGDDKRLALPERRLETAERWYDRGRYAQARDDAKQALTQLAKLDAELRAAPTPKPGDPKPKPDTPEELAAKGAIEGARDARVKAIVALVPDDKLKTPDKLLGLADTALEQGRAKSALLYATKATEEYLALTKPRVEIVTEPKAAQPKPKPGQAEPAAKNTCREAFLKIAHAERLAANTDGKHLTPAEKKQHDQGASLANVATTRLDAGKCDDALVLGEEAVATLFPIPLRPANVPSPKAVKKQAKKKPGTKKKPSTKKKPGTKKPGTKKPGIPGVATTAPRSWKPAYDKTRRALAAQDRAERVVIEAMKPTFDRGSRELALGKRAYERKRYADSERHADVAIAQFEAVIVASNAAAGEAPRTATTAGAPIKPKTKSGPRAKEAAWKQPYRAVYAALEMQKKAREAAKTEEAKKALAVGDAYMDKAQKAWRAKQYDTAHTHAAAAMVAFKLASDGDGSKTKPKKEITFRDADASLREARVIMTVCERDKCAERDFKALESAKLMLTSADEAMKEADYGYADELAKKAKAKMLEILDKPRPTAPKPATVDEASVKKAKDAIAEAQIQKKLCGPRECNKVNLEGWLRAEKDLAAARSALADNDPDRATRLANQAEGAFKGIVAPKATVPTFTIPADASSVSRAGSQLYVKPPIAFKTGSIKIDASSKPSIEALAKTLKANDKLIKSVRVIGYTDDRGSASLNKAISAKRAQSVVKALELAGVEPALLSSEGKGKDNPIADNSTAEGRAANRRVEIHIELK